MKELFEIEWLGGAAEKHFRKIRPEGNDLPWGTLDPKRYPPALVDRARVMWTENAITEYRAAAGFAEVLAMMLQAKVPLDLCGMAGAYVADEVLHVELVSRIAMELGGGAPLQVDMKTMSLPTTPGLTPLQRATEAVLRVSCIAETFSSALVTTSLKAATHPLVRGVEEIIARDEARHSRLGWLYLEWIGEDLDDAERARLSAVTAATLKAMSPLWKRPRSKVRDGITSEGWRLEDVHTLGWVESEKYVTRAREAVSEDILAPLRRYGIAPTSGEAGALLA